MIQLADIFKGTHPMTQGFGLNPLDYARFNIKGHNGIDFGMNNGTEIWSATDGIVLRAGDFTGTNFNGFGVLVEVWDDVQKVACLYAHLTRALVVVGQRVHARQLIALSDNSGNSTGPHLHFGVCKTDANGVRLYTANGFGGWLNASEPATGPSDGTNETFHWTFTNQVWSPTPLPAPTPVPVPVPDPIVALRLQLAQAQAALAGEKQTSESFRQQIAASRVRMVAAEHEIAGCIVNALDKVIPPP